MGGKKNIAGMNIQKVKKTPDRICEHREQKYPRPNRKASVEKQGKALSI